MTSPWLDVTMGLTGAFQRMGAVAPPGVVAGGGTARATGVSFLPLSVGGKCSACPPTTSYFFAVDERMENWGWESGA